MNKLDLSIVIPVHNEEDVLELLFERLIKVCDNLNKSFEIIFTNDGSRDNSEEVLNKLQQRRPKHVRVIHFNGNFGQHMAIMAALERIRGEVTITLDADLQNPPEEIPKLLEKIEAGHDVVGTFREKRQDSWWRLFVSRTHNLIRAKITPGIHMQDEGCMFRAYRKNIVDLVVSSGEASTFINALALHYAVNPIEIPVKHEARAAGETSYSFYKLIRYNFDLVTNFSLVPLQFFTSLGLSVSFFSMIFLMYTILRRIIVGPEADGVIILFAMLIFLAGLILLGLGITGEYVGRIYQEVRRRPRFVIREIQEDSEDKVSKIA